MSEDVKRGAVKMAIDEKVGCVPVLTAICFVGQTLQEDSKLVSDAQKFRYKILFQLTCLNYLNYSTLRINNFARIPHKSEYGYSTN